MEPIHLKIVLSLWYTNPEWKICICYHFSFELMYQWNVSLGHLPNGETLFMRSTIKDVNNWALSLYLFWNLWFYLIRTISTAKLPSCLSNGYYYSIQNRRRIEIVIVYLLHCMYWLKIFCVKLLVEYGVSFQIK